MMDKQYRDIPFAECCKQFETHMRNGHLVFQKFTCDHCGARQTMVEPNKMFMIGHCQECNRHTNILNCGFSAMITVGGSDDVC